MKIIKLYLFLILLVLVSSLGSLSLAAKEQQIITFAIVGYSQAKHDIYRQQIALFEKMHPNIKIRLITLMSRNYADLLNEALLLRGEFDVINWFAGDRLNTLVSKGMLSDLELLWQQSSFDNIFSESIKNAASIDGKVYGIPVASYVWGFYYKKSLFDRLGLAIPKNWHDFHRVLRTLQNNHISPIALGSLHPWHIAGWFEYILLRTYGADFYRQVINGDVSYKSKRIKVVFEIWKELLDKNYFFTQHKSYDGQELMPLLYREAVGLNLIGSFVLSHLPKKYRDEFGFFPFPQISETLTDNSSLSPLSIIAIAKWSKNKSGIREFVNFMAQKDTQMAINTKYSTLSPMKSIVPKQPSLLYDSYQIFKNADFHSQYFDIQMNFSMAEFAKKEFALFIEHRDIELTLELLEAQRVKIYQ